MTTFRELNAWKKAMELTDRVYDLVRQFPADERYALCDQLRRAVVSIPSNIAEGFGRQSHKDFAHFLSQARGSLYEVDTQLEIAARRGYILQDAVPVDLLNDTSKLISGLSRSLLVPSPAPQSATPQAQGTSPSPQSTKPNAQGTMPKAQCTMHKAQSTRHSLT